MLFHTAYHINVSQWGVTHCQHVSWGERTPHITPFYGGTPKYQSPYRHHVMGRLVPLVAAIPGNKHWANVWVFIQGTRPRGYPPILCGHNPPPPASSLIYFSFAPIYVYLNFIYVINNPNFNCAEQVPIHLSSFKQNIPSFKNNSNNNCVYSLRQRCPPPRQRSAEMQIPKDYRKL